MLIITEAYFWVILVFGECGLVEWWLKNFWKILFL